MPKSVLCVCLGNICRSPLAEAILRHKARELGIALEVDSAGTTGLHCGDTPDARGVVAARVHGYDMSGIQARKIQPADFDRHDVILVMDHSNAQDVEAMRPAHSQTPVVLLGRFSDPADADIPDPYYTGKFKPVIARIEAGIDGFLAQLQVRAQ